MLTQFIKMRTHKIVGLVIKVFLTNLFLETCWKSSWDWTIIQVSKIPSCNKNYSQKVNQNTHLLICDKSFSNKCVLKKHVEKVHEIGSTTQKYKSPSYNESCTQKKWINHHTMITSWNSKTSKCLICYQSFHKKCEPKKPVDLVHKNEDLHNCRICGKSFSHKFMRLEQP